MGRLFKKYYREKDPECIGHVEDSPQNFLAHFGILGMKWGIRRFQNPDGTRTAAGKERYNKGQSSGNKNINHRVYSARQLRRMYDDFLYGRMKKPETKQQKQNAINMMDNLFYTGQQYKEKAKVIREKEKKMANDLDAKARNGVNFEVRQTDSSLIGDYNKQWEHTVKRIFDETQNGNDSQKMYDENMELFIMDMWNHKGGSYASYISKETVMDMRYEWLMYSSNENKPERSPETEQFLDRFYSLLNKEYHYDAVANNCDVLYDYLRKQLI